MERTWAVFRAACFAQGCTWKQDCRTYRAALDAGHEHRVAYPDHVTYVMRRERQRLPSGEWE